MAAYLIANYNITNPEGYKAYPPAVLPTLAACDAKMIIGDFDTEVVEGTAGRVSIVVEFASKEALREWYESEAYQSIAHLRTDNSEGTLVFVDGVE